MANLLITNDDGIESKLWSHLCDALALAGHNVYGIAPSRDQSWISCAQTLGKDLTLVEIAPQRFSLDGTPADCAAVAPVFLANITDTKTNAPLKIVAVISGINIGVNTRLPLVLTSGTVGAASTGAILGYRAIAFSYAMPREFSAEAKKSGGIVPQTLAATEAMIAHCVTRVGKLLGEEKIFGRVINVNFPAAVTRDTRYEIAPMALTPVVQYFEKTGANTYKQNLKSGWAGKPINAGRTEFEALGEGNISETIIDWPKIGA